jgi:uncharacterized protein (DUF885 family)
LFNMSEPFPALAKRVVEELLAADPRLAATSGEHRYDDRLPDYSADGLANRVRMLRSATDALAGLDEDALDTEQKVDHAQLTALVDSVLFDLTEVREAEWNPLAHNPGDLLFALVARPFAPAEQRLEAIAARLRALPDALAVAQSSLTNCPRIHLETGIGQFRGTAAFVQDEVPALLNEAPALRSTVEPAVAGALTALEEFAQWLEGQLERGEDGRDPRLGRRLWEARLWHMLDTELTATEVMRRAQANLDQVTAEIRQAAAELIGGPATDDTVREALNRLADERPDDSSIVDLARVSLDETTAFVREHDLASLVDDPVVIVAMPEFARGVAVAYCDAPGPLETASVPTFYCISPTPSGWSPERVESFYREYNNHMVRNLTVHEAMPGHYLQLAHARRNSGVVRAVARSESFVEGWAVYTEEVMTQYGFGGLPVRLQQLKMQLRSTINAILDQQVHCDNLTEGEAMALMTQRGFQEEGEAAGKWRRALLTSAQLSTYFVGYTEMAEIGAARPADVSQRAWHDAMLGQGSPSPRNLRRLLLAPGSPAMA